jgi:ribosomal protein L16 Arg81 hydroxylase
MKTDINSISEAKKEFARLIHPLDINTFFEQYWEQRPLIITREQPNYYSDLFSRKDVDKLVCLSELKFPNIQLSKKGESFPWRYQSQKDEDSHYDSTVINELYHRYAQGHTIALNSLEKKWQPVLLLCQKLSLFLHAHAHINAYYTPQNSRGFDPHFDHQEVFVLQIEGSKRWRLYKPFQLCPLSSQQRYQIPRHKLPELQHEILLKPGDLLYMPSGCIHEASTADTSSLHLTIGVHVYRWLDLINKALMSVAKNNVSWRKSLPLGFLKQPEAIYSLKQHFQTMLTALDQNIDVETAIEQIRHRFIDEILTPPDGHFTQIDRLNSVNLDTVVVKRHSWLCRIFSDLDSASIQFPNNTIKGPKHIEQALHFIADTERFPVKAIPNTLTATGKLVLVRRLVKEGLLMIASDISHKQQNQKKVISARQLNS